MEEQRFPTFAHWLKTARQQRGLTQAELARRMHYETSLIRKVESGQRQATPKFRQRLATALNLPAAAIPDPALLTVTNVHIPQDNGQVPDAGPLFPGSYLPLRANPLFVGRDEFLQQVAGAFTTRQTICLGQTVIATGLGGIGKTQLAVEFAHRYGRFFPGGVFWLNFAAPEAIPNEVARCGRAEHLNLSPDFDHLPRERQVALVQRAWQEPAPRLLIFDNCEDENLLEQWRPATGGCHILITSRCQRWDPYLDVTHLMLDVLPRADSVTLLRRFVSTIATTDAATIAAALGDLPLALHLAGSYLALAGETLSPQAYLQQLQTRGRLRHLSLQTGPLSPTHHETHVARTFTLSVERLDAARPVDQLALALLARAACLAPGEPIPPDLLAALAGAPVEAALARLAQLGLVTIGVGESIRLHQLIAEFVQELFVDEEMETAVNQALLRLTEQGNATRDLYPARHWQIHLRHVTIAAQARADLTSAALAQALGWHLWLCGDYQAAALFLEAALALRRRLLGESHPDVATTLDSLGRTWQTLNEREKAGACLEAALAIRQQALGTHHPLTAESHNSLGLVYQVLGKFPAARQQFETAVALRRQELGASHPDTGFSIFCLALHLDLEGHFEQAKEAAETALRIARQSYGPHHPDIARILNGLGNIYRKGGEYETARYHYEEALALRREILGQEHNDTLTTLHNLGNLLIGMGLLAEARPLLAQTLAIRQARFGPDHLATAQSFSAMAFLMFKSGDYEAAQPLLEEAVSRYESATGATHALTAHPLLNLGQLYHRLGKWEAAQECYQRALAIRLAQLGEQHELTAVTLTCLGDLHTDRGERATAADYLARARHTLTQSSAHKLALARNSHAYGRLLRATGDEEAALRYFAAALTLREQHLGPDHPDTQQSRQMLAARP